MSGYRRVNYYELCRLCTSSEGDRTNIFREEGRRRQLQTKIQTYLPIQVLEEDSLPKIVCHTCIRKLENYIEFRENVVSAESMLESYFTSLRFSEDFRKEGKVYVKSNEKERSPSSPEDPLKIDKMPESDEQIIVAEPQTPTPQQVVVGNLNASNIQIISGVQARVQQYKCAMQMQSGGVASAVVESTAETHYSYQQQASQQVSPDNSPSQSRITDSQPQTNQIQVQNQIQSQNQMNLQPQRQQQQQQQQQQQHQQQQQQQQQHQQQQQQPQTCQINQIQQLREFEKCQMQIAKDDSQNQQPQVVHHQGNTVLLKTDVNTEVSTKQETENQNISSPEDSVQNYTTVQATPEVFLSLGFKDSGLSQQTTRDDVKEFKDYIKNDDDTITRNSIGQISEFLRIRTCPETNSLITVNPQVICQNGRNLLCRDCGKTFESMNQMNSHQCPSSPLINEVSEITTKDEPLQSNNTSSFNCDICGKPFKRKEHLFQHRKLHTGERPYVCTTCAKAFSRKEHLVRHSVSHTGQKMHECEMCGKSFSRKDNLHKHRKTHGVSGPYICETCGKSFVVKHYYLMHLTTHAPTPIDGDNCQDPLPYKCDLCHKAFSVKQYLTTHKLRHRSKNNQNNANQNQNNQTVVQQSSVSTTNGVIANSVTSTSNLSNNNGQNEQQVVEMQSVIDRNEQGQPHNNFGNNQYHGNIQQFQ